MSYKTPEQLAWENSKFSGWLNDDYSIVSIKQAFLAGYEAARPNWVSVKERLPEKQDKYLVWCDVGCISPSFTHLTANWFATESGGKWEVDSEGVDGRDYDLLKIIVTHWQPLPEPPKDL